MVVNTPGKAEVSYLAARDSDPVNMCGVSRTHYTLVPGLVKVVEG